MSEHEYLLKNMSQSKFEILTSELQHKMLVLSVGKFTAIQQSGTVA
jgi:hypothetical protein